MGTALPDAGSGRLLVIEDDDHIARLVTRALNKDGYRVDREATGPAGLNAALAGIFDLIVLDLMLPGMSGTTVLRRLLEHQPSQRVIVLSAMPQIGTRIACLDAGAVDFVGKPFSLAEFRARVRARIRLLPHGAATDALTIGPVQLDLQSRHAIVNGQEILLSDREFVLLRYLMRQAGQVCTRPELLEDIWGFGFDPRSNVVDVYIRRLRSKLDHPDRIETVRHVGYRFTAD